MKQSISTVLLFSFAMYAEKTYTAIGKTNGNKLGGFFAHTDLTYTKSIDSYHFKNKITTWRYAPARNADENITLSKSNYIHKIAELPTSNIIQDTIIINGSPPNVSFIKKAKRCGYVGYREYRIVKLKNVFIVKINSFSTKN